MMTNEQAQHDNRVDDTDQDTEPSMMAPEEGRPDGAAALSDDNAEDAGVPGVTPTAPHNDEQPETD
ncbi:MAG TPA: hypothetical protein VFL99_09335 [Segeticoccus sp.]|uniref:hypothetical protein n=1 Tax=Segeticoccus sp. TaxID=2706531 RepID=UPI002D7EECCB|nr:hypothetical protein [Segeticoccus sp.]HET8600517.1 hypothetical protein [Segeticoccus sp.]